MDPARSSSTRTAPPCRPWWHDRAGRQTTPPSGRRWSIGASRIGNCLRAP